MMMMMIIIIIIITIMVIIICFFCYALSSPSAHTLRVLSFQTRPLTSFPDTPWKAKPN